MKTNRFLPFMLVIIVMSLLLVAAPPATAQDEVVITYLSILQDDVGFNRVIGELSAQCLTDMPNVRYEREGINLDALGQRIDQLALNNNLPTLFSADSGPQLIELIDNGYVLNVEELFTELGIYDSLNPAAAAIAAAGVQGRGLYALPLELNIEGFWYNKQMFADHDLDVPTTWDEMLAAAAVFHENGIQAFALAGREKWPITRYLAAYANRVYGADAMVRVRDGELMLTDPGFIEAAQELKDMAESGYFGVSPTTLDYGTALDLFNQGRAAMYYMGSWELRSFNDPAQALIGTENIGYFNVPLVEGGEGTLEDFSINVGTTTIISSAGYNETVGEWIRCVFSQYGDHAMNTLGMITGFNVNNPSDDLPQLTQIVLENLDTANDAFLWWEAYFNPRASVVAGDNAQLLISDPGYTAEQYMTDLQAALDEGV